MTTYNDRHAIFRNSSSNYTDNEDKKIEVPPEDIILNFFELAPDFSVQGDMIKYDESLDYKIELGEVDRALVEAILASDSGIVTRSELLKAGIERGLNESSLQVSITYSPLLKHIGIDTYKLIGKNLETGTLLAHRDIVASKTKRKSLLFSDWHQGLIRLVVRCPQFNSLVVGSPSMFKSYLTDKKFRAVDENGDSFGTIGINSRGTIYGMNTFVAQKNVRENDILVIMFDILDSVAHLHIADINEFQDMVD
ncbi:hypothetical protein [Porticoccus sp.]|uniref:hypothetical protein n=1 Tax=Porticoccus sp. TaxID=2024853 RepID=UPI003F695F19